MGERTSFLMYARRLHNALRYAISSGDGRTDDEWLNVEKPQFTQYACGMYLIGCLSYLEGKYGKRCWSVAGKNHSSFEEYKNGLKERRKTALSPVTVESLDALICIRNGVTHNESDLSRNDDANCVSKVTQAAIPGVLLTGTVVTLQSDDTVDFMESVRKAFIAVSGYHGET